MIIVVDNVIVDVGRRQEQVEFLFECEHLAVDLRAIGLEALGQIHLFILKIRSKSGFPVHKTDDMCYLVTANRLDNVV